MQRQCRGSKCHPLQVSQKNGRDLDPDHHMWIDYMRARRAKGAGYMHPEMKLEMDRVDRMIGALDTSPMYVAAPSHDHNLFHAHVHDTLLSLQ